MANANQQNTPYSAHVVCTHTEGQSEPPKAFASREAAIAHLQGEGFFFWPDPTWGMKIETGQMWARFHGLDGGRKIMTFAEIHACEVSEVAQ